MFKTLRPALTVVGFTLVASNAMGQSTQEPPRVTLPPVEVSAQKEPENPQILPLSVTVMLREWLTQDDSRTPSEAGWFSPNTFFSEFSARKLSNARVRGVGSSPANPGVTSYIDGVPQLNANSSSIEFLDVDQVEFVRGPQSALFGPNALGSVINIMSRKPSLTKWTGSAIAPFGNFASGDVRASASGPLMGNKLGASFGFGYTRRDGFTVNDVTGKDIDSRSASFGKAQLLWKPNAQWEARALFSGERARDGDYALSDLGGLRSSPFHAFRSIDGFTHRNIRAQTVPGCADSTRSARSGFETRSTRTTSRLRFPIPASRRQGLWAKWERRERSVSGLA